MHSTAKVLVVYYKVIRWSEVNYFHYVSEGTEEDSESWVPGDGTNMRGFVIKLIMFKID
jgi:hypothetical protein